MQGKVDITTVGGRIKHLRTQAELSQDELAELLNLENRASVSSYETNRRAVSGELAVELAISKLESLLRLPRCPFRWL